MDGLQGGVVQAGHDDPVRRLLTIGKTDIGDPADWPDYTVDPGVGHEHAGALIALACDLAVHHGDPSVVWAPLHAWRALAQLRVEAAVAPLLALLELIEGDEAADIELPVVFGMIGPPAIPHIAAFIANRGNPEGSVITAISGLTEIGVRHADGRGECIGVLARMLEPQADASPAMNGFAVCALIDLGAVEAIDTIRDAYRRDAVDISIPGDIEDVEIGLGLRNQRATPARRYLLQPAGGSPLARLDRGQRNRPSPVRRAKTGRNAPCPCGSGKKYKKCCLQQGSPYQS